MLYFIFISAIISSVTNSVIKPVRHEHQEVFRLSPEAILNVQKYSLPCIQKYNADSDIFEKLIDGVLPNDDTSKNFLICFTVSGKFSDEEGHFNIPRMSSLIGNHRRLKEFEDTLAECNKITKENPTETAYQMSICINENSPVVFSL